ncbi:MAG: PHP domain-containing protein [Acholeplasmatales bacterium]|jgi:predicted metal-dependent phosphoesterase TrpH|nr:PHP domain-containing protein [Acholeplasmatales bacterium]
MKINLHTHTSISDGKLDPKQLADEFNKNKLEIVSLTDHDMLSGIYTLQNELDSNITLINGIELTVSAKDLELDELKDYDAIHMLAYNFDIEKLESILMEKGKSHFELIKDVYKRLKDAGYEIEIDTSAKLLRYSLLTRGLFKENYFEKKEEALKIIEKYGFNDYQFYLTSIIDAIDIVHSCNGIILLAHPFNVVLNSRKTEIEEVLVNKIIQKLILLGLDGIEAYYFKYNSEKINFLENLANEAKILKSAGTDFYEYNRTKSNLYYDINENQVKDILKVFKK